MLGADWLDSFAVYKTDWEGITCTLGQARVDPCSDLLFD
jgi:hypothetical protein